jgi:eukaryotic-like serine/threonine-protein kinase
VLEIVFEDGLPGLGGEGELAPVRLQALADFDPQGDGTEHPESVSAATDRDSATYWTTEEYRSFDKSGVGLLLDSGSRTGLSRVVVVTDTPGFRATILGGSTRRDFVDVSEEQQVRRRTAFDVDTRGEPFRYYVVWITDPNGVAHVNEVRAFVSQ